MPTRYPDGHDLEGLIFDPTCADTIARHLLYFTSSVSNHKKNAELAALQLQSRLYRYNLGREYLMPISPDLSLIEPSIQFTIWPAIPRSARWQTMSTQKETKMSR